MTNTRINCHWNHDEGLNWRASSESGGRQERGDVTLGGRCHRHTLCDTLTCYVHCMLWHSNLLCWSKVWHSNLLRCRVVWHWTLYMILWRHCMLWHYKLLSHSVKLDSTSITNWTKLSSLQYIAIQLAHWLSKSTRVSKVGVATHRWSTDTHFQTDTQLPTDAYWQTQCRIFLIWWASGVISVLKFNIFTFNHMVATCGWEHNSDGHSANKTICSSIEPFHLIRYHCDQYLSC